MQTLSKSGTLPTEVSSETKFKSGIDVEKGKVPQKPKMLSLLDRELLTREASSRLLLTLLSFQGNMGGMLKASETPPPQRRVALQSDAEAPENTTKDVSEDEKETEIT